MNDENCRLLNDGLNNLLIVCSNSSPHTSHIKPIMNSHIQIFGHDSFFQLTRVRSSSTHTLPVQFTLEREALQ